MKFKRAMILTFILMLLPVLIGCGGGTQVQTTGTAQALDLSNKWRIKVDNDAKSDGNMVFRVTPKDRPAVDVTVQMEKGTNENRVAVAIRDAFKAQLPKDGYHIERDDWEDVLVKKRGDTPNFELKLISNSVEKVSIDIRKE